MKIFKYLTYIFLLSLFFAKNALYAEFLSFKVGNKVSYTISQKLNAEYEMDDEKCYAESEAKIDVDIEILASNEQTFSYPFDVQVVLKKVVFSEIVRDGQTSEMMKYDSNSLKTENYAFGSAEYYTKEIAEHFDKLINHPLIFRVEKDFQIKETTNYLTQIDKDYSSPSHTGLFGATPWTFEFLLTQLFHLSGENLQLANLYPTSCYQILNWEDGALDEQEISIDQFCVYTIIDEVDSKTIEASWQGKAKVKDIEDDLDGNIALIGNVTWDITNPMIQKRDLKVKIEEIHAEVPSQIKISVHQIWEPVIEL